MPQPAARVSDMHTCPMVTGVVPHVGGPILPPGCPTVLIGGLPAARMGDQATCVGPPDVIVGGNPAVLIGGPARRAHGRPHRPWRHHRPRLLHRPVLTGSGDRYHSQARSASEGKTYPRSRFGLVL